jgi:hypothetical protein|tara:strand:+ start:289 stop:537 length:249 start_codon:yes stop_codon:yes gene_type:complete
MIVEGELWIEGEYFLQRDLSYKSAEKNKLRIVIDCCKCLTIYKNNKEYNEFIKRIKFKDNTHVLIWLKNSRLGSLYIRKRGV